MLTSMYLCPILDTEAKTTANKGHAMRLAPTLTALAIAALALTGCSAQSAPSAPAPRESSTTAPIARPTSTPTPTAPASTPAPQPVAAPLDTVTTAPVCEEDEPCWDCSTMGNKICGPTQATAPEAAPVAFDYVKDAYAAYAAPIPEVATSDILAGFNATYVGSYTYASTDPTIASVRSLTTPNLFHWFRYMTAPAAPKTASQPAKIQTPAPVVAKPSQPTTAPAHTCTDTRPGMCNMAGGPGLVIPTKCPAPTTTNGVKSTPTNAPEGCTFEQ